MSVIGRLDDQVEAVLINPLKRRERRRSDGEAEQDAPPLPPPVPSHEERDAESSEETRDTDAALPVWLL
jgi:hypothetical protein